MPSTTRSTFFRTRTGGTSAHQWQRRDGRARLAGRQMSQLLVAMDPGLADDGQSVITVCEYLVSDPSFTNKAFRAPAASRGRHRLTNGFLVYPISISLTPLVQMSTLNKVVETLVITIMTLPFIWPTYFPQTKNIKPFVSLPLRDKEPPYQRLCLNFASHLLWCILILCLSLAGTYPSLACPLTATHHLLLYMIHQGMHMQMCIPNTKLQWWSIIGQILLFTFLDSSSSLSCFWLLFWAEHLCHDTPMSNKLCPNNGLELQFCTININSQCRLQYGIHMWLFILMLYPPPRHSTVA